MQINILNFFVHSISAQGALLNESEKDEIHSLLTKHHIPFSSSTQEDKELYKINSKDLFNFDFKDAEKVLLAQTNVLIQLPLELRTKILNGMNGNFLNLMRQVYPIELEEITRVKAKHSYVLHYLSKRSNHFEKRQITTIKQVRLGSQLFIEAFCFKRKRIRWFEYGRIKKIYSCSFLPIPEKAKRFEKVYRLKFNPHDLTNLKWLFRDILNSYTNTTMDIHVCDFDYLKKELQNMNQVQLLKT